MYGIAVSTLCFLYFCLFLRFLSKAKSKALGVLYSQSLALVAVIHFSRFNTSCTCISYFLTIFSVVTWFACPGAVVVLTTEIFQSFQWVVRAPVQALVYVPRLSAHFVESSYFTVILVFINSNTGTLFSGSSVVNLMQIFMSVYGVTQIEYLCWSFCIC